MKRTAEIVTACVTGEMRFGKYTGYQRRVAHADIERLAYRFYEARGWRDGHQLEDWLRAERELTGPGT